MRRVLTVIDAPGEMRTWSESARSDATIALVPTMGALHRGHLELIRVAAAHADLVAVSIFVNPLQFGESTDFQHYPRPLDDDIEACRSAGVHVVYAPEAATMYPDGFATTVAVADLVDPMEGTSRPGHFDGVTTVVTKLLIACHPHVAVFGEKDFQQLAIVRRMVADLDMGTEIIAAPTVREPDGLALSSRNRRLTAEQRRAAICMPLALDAAKRVRSAGGGVTEVVAAASAVIHAEPLAALDYAVVFHSGSLRPLERFGPDDGPGDARLAIAAHFGEIRLIDNCHLPAGHGRTCTA